VPFVPSCEIAVSTINGQVMPVAAPPPQIYPTVTRVKDIVSFPKMSTTLTAMVYLPGAS
jgi:hypothetical protein